MSQSTDGCVHAKPTVLLVEDEILIAEDIRQALGDEGFSVCATPSSAAEAMEACFHHRPDIAIVDIRLRGTIDGIDTADALREQFNVPIVFLTAHADQSDLERAKRVEPVGFVMKPVVIPELVAGLKLGMVKHAAERKLRASERRLATTLRCLSDAVVVVDHSDTVVFINEASERLLQLSSDEALGQPVTELFSIVHPHERHSLLTDIHNLSQYASENGSRSPIPREGLLLRKGEELPVEIQSAAMQDEAGTLLGSILVMRDISEQLRIDAIRIQLEERLFQVQKMEALGQLAGGIAHDFNNLLTAIMGNIALLRQHAIPSQGKLLGATEQACSRATELVRQLLSFGRTDTEALTSVDLGPIITEVVAVLHAASPEPITVETKIKNPLPSVLGNSSQLYQLVMNLCINARDAVLEARHNGSRRDAQRHDINLALSRKPTPPHLRATISGDAPDVVELLVRDYGIGMTEETKRRIFDPFFTTKPVGKGTGLGLATVYGVIRKLGGAIEVETELNSGTTFRVLLPAQASTSHRSYPFAAISAAFRGSGLIIIADDDPVVRDIIGAMFGELGYQTVGAATASDLLSILKIRHSEVRVILCAGELPDLPYTTLISTIHDHSPKIPIIVITSHGSPALEIPLLSHVSVLQKPYKLSDLAREVSSVASNREHD